MVFEEENDALKLTVRLEGATLLLAISSIALEAGDPPQKKWKVLARLAIPSGTTLQDAASVANHWLSFYDPVFSLKVFGLIQSAFESVPSSTES